MPCVIATIIIFWRKYFFSYINVWLFSIVRNQFCETGTIHYFFSFRHSLFLYYTRDICVIFASVLSNMYHLEYCACFFFAVIIWVIYKCIVYCYLVTFRNSSISLILFDNLKYINIINFPINDRKLWKNKLMIVKCEWNYLPKALNSDTISERFSLILSCSLSLIVFGKDGCKSNFPEYKIFRAVPSPWTCSKIQQNVISISLMTIFCLLSKIFFFSVFNLFSFRHLPVISPKVDIYRIQHNP